MLSVEIENEITKLVREIPSKCRKRPVGNILTVIVVPSETKTSYKSIKTRETKSKETIEILNHGVSIFSFTFTVSDRVFHHLRRMSNDCYEQSDSKRIYIAFSSIPRPSRVDLVSLRCHVNHRSWYW